MEGEEQNLWHVTDIFKNSFIEITYIAEYSPFKVYYQWFLIYSQICTDFTTVEFACSEYFINGVMQHVALSVWPFYLASCFQGSCKLQHVSALHFYGWIIFHLVAIPQFIYPFFSWWALGLIPGCSYDEQCCSDHSCTSFCMGIHFSTLLEWNCWVL